MTELRVEKGDTVAHHTLYYRKAYERHRLTRAWRNHPLMIIPLSHAAHNDVHKNVAPLAPPSEILARVALDFCALHQRRFDTGVEGFMAVSEYLHDVYRKASASTLGQEALRCNDQFNRQIAYIDRIEAKKNLRS